MQSRTEESVVAWKEFCAQAEKRYCSPHFNMEKKMEFYGFKQNEDGKPILTVDEYKEKFLHLHKYAPEVTGDALKMKFIEGLTGELKFQVKGVGCTDFLDIVAKGVNYEKWEAFNKNKRMIPMGHRSNGAAANPQNLPNQTSLNRQGSNMQQRRGPLPNAGNGNGNQKKRTPVRWQQDSEFLERAQRLGLCFRCGEQGHQTFECPNKVIDKAVRVKMAEMETIDNAEDKGKSINIPLWCFTFSVHHLKASVIKFVGKIKNQKLNFLINSGSTHCFLSSKLVKRLNLQLTKEIKRPVELASGNKTFTNGLIENLSFSWNEQNHKSNFFVIDMGVHDVVIGMDWMIENHVLIDCEQ